MWSVVAFAGYCFLHATLAFGQSGWTQQFPSQTPSGRNFHTMVYDAARNEVVLFGGIANNSGVLGDTWVWDGFNWIQKSPPNSPSPRFGHAMAYDAVRQEVVLFEDCWQSVQAMLKPGCGTGPPGFRCFPPSTPSRGIWQQ